MAKKAKGKSVIRCDKCGSDKLKTLSTRETNEIRNRRKQCLACGYRFTTYEIRKEDFEALWDIKSSLNSFVESRNSLNRLLERIGGMEE